jgi:hypothetical protein
VADFITSLPSLALVVAICLQLHSPVGFCGPTHSYVCLLSLHDKWKLHSLFLPRCNFDGVVSRRHDADCLPVRWQLLHVHDGVIFSPLSLWEKKGRKLNMQAGLQVPY